MKTGKFLTTASGESYALHYQIWEDDQSSAPSSRSKGTLVCVHGLTGNADDFHYVGNYLSKIGYRVAAIDMAGRGRSAYYRNADDYQFDQYLVDLKLFLKEIGCDAPASCDWLGVSMGGLLGFRLSGIPQSPIRRMILSDIGPQVPQFDLDFISKVIKLTPEYSSPADAIPILKMAQGTPYSRGPMTDEHWYALANGALKQREDGKYIRNFDPAIAKMFDQEPLGKEDLWAYWEKTYQPTLSLRGALSTLFPLSIADDMRARKPNQLYDLVEIAEAGHVPSLFPDDQIRIIADWLESTYMDSETTL